MGNNGDTMNLLTDLTKIHLEEKNGFIGLNDEFFSLCIKKIFDENNQDILIVTPTLFEANIISNYLSVYLENNYLFPMDDFLTSESIAISPDLKITRLETLNKTLNKNKKIVVTHLNGYLRYLPEKELYEKAIVRIKKGDEYLREKLIKDLNSLGYSRETLVTKTGEIGVRGYIVDIFPIEYNHPIRIELSLMMK